MTNEEWYLETDITKLPEYLKNSNGDVIHVKYELREGKVYARRRNDNQEFGASDWVSLIYQVTHLMVPIPSNENEYNEYLKSKQ